MSNDTDFKLVFCCPTREQLEHVLWYLEFKKSRWSYWKNRGAEVDELRARVGASSKAAVVSWGFTFNDEINVSENGLASVTGKAWANENSANIRISGDNGEIADLRNRFPFLTVDGTYKDEQGNRGFV